MNQFIETLKSRRSIRSFKADMPTREELDQIIDAGLYAASGKNSQSSIIIAITNKEVRDKLSAANAAVMGKPGFDPFYGAPAILLVLSAKDVPTHVCDGALTMGNMMAAATALGLGSIWINRAREEFETDEWKTFLADLGIEGEWEGIGHCAVGYIEGDIPAPLTRKDGRVFWVE